jgi:hypothetical protein
MRPSGLYDVALYDWWIGIRINCVFFLIFPVCFCLCFLLLVAIIVVVVVLRCGCVVVALRWYVLAVRLAERGCCCVVRGLVVVFV